ncbi:MAG: PIG-L family deacetylase, partial [Actinomycetota bacterium]|nr:PIG-L family deacetylase [Actinomycetota bacterium]
RVAVVSPHLDDAVFSLGASIRGAVRRGTRVEVLTVLAGLPDSDRPAGPSNAKAGFSTSGEAARARRREDERACALLGAEPVWLGFPDDPYDGQPAGDDVARALAVHLAGCDAVLIPAFPLAHPDHLWVSRVALGVLEPGQVVGLYVEQPYASWNALSRARPIMPRASRDDAPARLGIAVRPHEAWRRGAAGAADWVAKARASREYRSQLAVLRRFPQLRVAAYEALRGGESVLWCRLRPPSGL